MFLSGCGGGSGISGGTLPVSTSTPAPVATPSIIPTGSLHINTGQPNGYATADLFSSGSASAPYQEITLNGNGRGEFTDIPLNKNVYIRIYESLSVYKTNPDNPLAGKNIFFSESEQEELIIVGTIEPTPAATLIPAPTSTPVISPDPVINSVKDSFVTIGDAITIEGSNFGNIQGSIKINNTEASVNSWTDSVISCNVLTGSYLGEGEPVSFTLETTKEKLLILIVFTYGQARVTVLDLSGPSGYVPVDICFVTGGTMLYILNYSDKEIIRYNFSSFSPTGNSGFHPYEARYFTYRKNYGGLYISQTINIFSCDDVFWSSFTFGSGNSGISWNSYTGELFCAKNTALSEDYISKYDAVGTSLGGFWITTGAGDIECDENGDIYVSNTGGFIEKYNSDGNLLTTLPDIDSGYLCSEKVNSQILLFSAGDKEGDGENIVVYINDEKSGHIPFGTGITLAGLDVFNGNIIGCDEEGQRIYHMKY